MATIKFSLSPKVDKSTSKQEVLIRFTHTGICKNAGTNVFILPQYWSQAEQQIITSELESEIKESRERWRKPTPEREKMLTTWNITLKELEDSKESLEAIASKVKDSFKTAVAQDVKNDKDWLRNLIVDYYSSHEPEDEPEDEPQHHTLLQAIDGLIESAERGERTVRKTQKPVDERTIVQYRISRKILQGYFDSRRLKDIELSNVNGDFYKSFVAYLYKQGYKLNTVGKHIKNIKAAINALPNAVRVDCEFVQPKKCIKLTENVDNVYLTEEELGKIASLNLTTPYLDKVRDQFLLLAWTGCRYSDLPKLKKDNILTLKNGGQAFKFEQKKTATKVVIPILPQLQVILEKYDYQVPEPMNNQPFNRFLKEIAKLAGLDEEVTITQTESINGKVDRVTHRFHKWECVTAHTARRSFATNMYNRGYPTLMIMKITGHKTEKAFLTYIKVTEEENAERMLELFK